MTGTTSVALESAPSPEPSSPTSRPRTPGHWRVSWHGVRTVAALELRQRVRSTKWIVALVVWFVVVGAIVLLLSGALSTMFGIGPGDESPRGGIMYGATTFLVIGLGLLVTPTLTSTSINGDRAAGTLATLQVTLLTPAEIVVGKVLAAWAAACAFLVLSLPYLFVGVAMGDIPWWSPLLTFLLIAAILLGVCGMGVGFSALVSRVAGSTVLTFVTAAALTLLSPLMFVLTYPTILQQETVRTLQTPPTWDGERDVECYIDTQIQDVAHTERTWWLLGLTPFVIVADGSATSSDSRAAQEDNDLLGVIRSGVRELRAGPPAIVDQCWTEHDPIVAKQSPDPVWPWGLGAFVVLGAAGAALAVRRLALPQATLPRGVRVA